MNQPAAKKDDRIVATDVHIELSADGTAKPMLHPFSGVIDDNLSRNVYIQGRLAAVKGSSATNSPRHLPRQPGATFKREPGNRGTITGGSQTVFVNGRPLARHNDPAQTCNDTEAQLGGQAVGRVVAQSTVFVGR